MNQGHESQASLKFLLEHNTTRHNTTRHNTTLHNTIQHNDTTRVAAHVSLIRNTESALQLPHITFQNPRTPWWCPYDEKLYAILTESKYIVPVPTLVFH